jgi:hypothetical protein
VKKIWKYCRNAVKWTAIAVVALLAVVVIAIYLPPVQRFIVDKALEVVNSSGDVQVDAQRVCLRFPLHVEVEKFKLSTVGGIEISADEAGADIAMLPLLTATIRVDEVKLANACVNIGTPDSTLYMRSEVGEATVTGAAVHLSQRLVDVNALDVTHGDINLILTPTDSVPTNNDATEPFDWQINLHSATMRSINYQMQMLPTIDSLRCKLPLATLTNGVIALKNNHVMVEELAIDNVDVAYFTPSGNASTATQPAATQPAATTSPIDSVTIASAPWLVEAKRLRLNNGHAVYAEIGVVPSSGFDYQYIEASEINVAVDSFMNCGTTVRVPLTKLSARERCGLAINASGVFAMDSLLMTASDFKITTPTSEIRATGSLGLDSDNAPLSAQIEASISPDDIRTMAPAALAPIAQALPPYSPLQLEVDVDGRLNNLIINRVSAEIPRHIALAASGTIADYTDINRANGTIKLTGTMADGNFVKASLFDAKTGRDINFPPLTLAGTVKVKNSVVDGNLNASTSTGDVALDAHWNNRNEGYDLLLECNCFPIQTILPQAKLKDIDATVSVAGTGIDFTNPSTVAQADVKLNHANYNGRDYDDVELTAALAAGMASLEARSGNRNARFNVVATGNVDGDSYNWTFSGDVQHIDLQALALADTISEGSISLSGTAMFSPAVAKTRKAVAQPIKVQANVMIDDVYWHMPDATFNGDNIKIAFQTDSTTSASLVNHDLSMQFVSAVPLDTLTSKLACASVVLQHGMAKRSLAIDTLQQQLPPFALTLSAKQNNVVANYLVDSDISFDHLQMNAMNDSLLSLNAELLGLTSGTTRIDTVTVAMRQRGDYLLYDAQMHNAPGTFDQFANVSAKGYVNGDRAVMLFKQENIEGETGYSLGAMARLVTPTQLELRLVPYHPIIGYKDWEINKDNVITYDFATQHYDANVDLRNDVSSLRLYTEHVETDSIEQEDLIVAIKNIKLDDWLAINPFAPPITGDVSADMRLSWDKPNLNGTGTVSLSNFTYGKKSVGDFDLAVDVSTNTAGTIRANTSLMVNGVKTITASGNLNDSTAANPFMLDFKMIQFPLSVLNPFLPQGTASLAGTLNGEMDVTGDLANPIFNGNLSFDATKVKADLLGTTFTFSDEKIPVENSVINFKNFTIKGVNANPLAINGTVDVNSLTSPRIDLKFSASNMQVIGAEKTRRSTVYGKAFVNLNASAKGLLSFLDVNADVNVLPGTDVTYVMADATTALSKQSTDNMVKFVNFNDTTSTVVAADTTIADAAMMMNLNAKLTISSGTTIAVDLDTQGKNKVQVQSSGTLNYALDYMNDERFSGRLTISDGFARYTVPVMGEKLFNFVDGSYIEFNGQMLDPTISLKAYDNVRANVTGDGGNSRVVNFQVDLNVSGTLNTMDVAFDLECSDDITIANELKSMSAEQRANQAMNLLITNMYNSSGTETIYGNVGTTALYSFLESQLNSLVSGIRGIDLSFGINQYDKTVEGSSTSAMTYSYKVSKSLFDNRFKIVVGGNYTTEAEADENFAENLISDISFEYSLNRAGTMYVRLFRHTGYESILEGEITQTGIGFVFQRKLNTLRDIFRIRRKQTELQPQPIADESVQQ